jgi:hypothetical protein
MSVYSCPVAAAFFRTNYHSVPQIGSHQGVRKADSSPPQIKKIEDKKEI